MAATGTVMPNAKPQWLDNNGNPAAGYQMFVYTAGTSTKATTYSDEALSASNTNPIILDSAGRASVFLAQSLSYRFVLATPVDTDPPTSPLWDVDNINTVPPSTPAYDITGTAGENLAAGDACYLSDGTGGLTAGRWYLASGASSYTATSAIAIGFAMSAITTGNTGLIRLLGQVTGLAGLTTGTAYYLGTSGGLTSSPPTYARLVGIADSTTSLVISQWVGVPVATPTVTGAVSTTTQSFAGDKTVAGAILSNTQAGIGYATGAGNNTVQSTNKSTGVTINAPCGTITMNNAALNAGTTVSFTLTNSVIAATDMVMVAIKSGATADSYVVGVQAVAAGSCSIFVRNTTAATNLSEALQLTFVVIKAVAA